MDNICIVNKTALTVEKKYLVLGPPCLGSIFFKSRKNLNEWTFYYFVMCKCMDTTVCVNGTAKSILFLSLRTFPLPWVGMLLPYLYFLQDTSFTCFNITLCSISESFNTLQ